MGRDFEAAVSIGFWVHASACLSITVRRWDDSTQSAQVSRWFPFPCTRIYDPLGARWGNLFLNVLVYLSLGKSSLYYTPPL
jgi:hypothetical protein